MLRLSGRSHNRNMKKIYIICLVMVFLMSCKNENNHASHSNATTITIVTESEDVLSLLLKTTIIFFPQVDGILRSFLYLIKKVTLSDK